MSEASIRDHPARAKWNERFAAGAAGAAPDRDQPSEWLVENADLLAVAGPAENRPAPPRALDVACGNGRNSLYLAQLAFAVDALDISDVAIEGLRGLAAQRGLAIDAHLADLEDDPLPASAYDVVVCMNYLQRDLFGALAGALRRGGLLLYETVTRAHVEQLGNSFDARFTLDHNELLHAFTGLRVVRYREGVVARAGRPRAVASLVAQRPS